MSTTDHLLTHDQFRKLICICLDNMGIPSEFQDSILEGFYPAKPVDALAELMARGYAATLEDVCVYCCDKSNGVLRKSGSYWLTHGDIDRIAAVLEEQDKINGKARERLQSGTTAEAKLAETASDLLRTLDQRRIASCTN